MVAWAASKNGVAEENITVDLALDTCKLDRRSTLAHYGIVEGNTADAVAEPAAGNICFTKMTTNSQFRHFS